MRKYFVFLLFSLIACVQVPGPSESLLSDALSCAVDSDCACGVSRDTGDCMVGPSALVDASRQCPDFCTGIAGHLETKCVNHKCANVPRTAPPVIACTEEAKLCPDGSGVGRVGPDCEFAPCPKKNEVQSDLSNAHWQCDDWGWKQNPEQCFENACVEIGR